MAGNQSSTPQMAGNNKQFMTEVGNNWGCWSQLQQKSVLLSVPESKIREKEYLGF